MNSAISALREPDSVRQPTRGLRAAMTPWRFFAVVTGFFWVARWLPLGSQRNRFLVLGWDFAVYQYLSLMVLVAGAAAMSQLVRTRSWVLWPAVATATLGSFSLFDAVRYPSDAAQILSSGLVFSGHWVVAFVDLAVVLGPALSIRRRAVRVPSREAWSKSTLTWLAGSSVVLVGLVLELEQSASYENLAAPGLVGMVLAAVLGLATQPRKRWSRFVTFSFAAWAGGLFAIPFGYLDQVGLLNWAPLCVAGLFALGSRASSLLLRAAMDPWLGVLLLNSLNAIDAVATYVQLRSGRIVEVNPVIVWGGLWPKVLAVLVSSLLLARVRPQALPYPIAIYAAVVLWHVAGAWFLT